MHLVENLDIISKLFPVTYKVIKDLRIDKNSNRLRVEKAKNGLPTILYENASGMVYLHSKYDPVVEAQRFIGQYKDVDRYKHVFFYGVGMGYHIEEFCRNWPDKKITIYEPEQNILLYYLEERQLTSLPLRKCKGIYTGSSEADIKKMLQEYINQINGEVLFVILPSYERIFAEELRILLEGFRTAISNKRSSLQAEMDFQKLWTINSIKNFKEVMNSRGMLQNRKCFADKPAILAAAGPSLGEELENLRTIKKNGQAYIFSVGSAINTLLANNILPDAICIYDPAPNTNEVIKKVKEQGLEIPLVYGSSVYNKAIRSYPGPKLHILNSQDTISAYFLKNNSGEKLQTIIDAPSIAIITLQVLVALGCNPIILVGQNFAYKDNRYYAQGIEYASRPGELQNVDEAYALEAEDVHGGRVRTSQLFNHMRDQMEMYIEHCGCLNIINATKGGASIRSTVYKPLEALAEKELLCNSVGKSWLDNVENGYDIDYMISQGKTMTKEKEAAEEIIEELIGTLSLLGSECDAISLQKALNRFEKGYNKLIANDFFNYVLRPMSRVQFEIVIKNISDITEIKDTEGKARFIAETFGDVFEGCKKDMEVIRYDFDDMIQEIMDKDIKVMSFTIKGS